MSFKVPEELVYSKDDEWLRIEGDEAVIGITDYAQDALSDIVFVELPAAGSSFGAGEPFGVVESVKAASDLFMPVDGEIIEVNDDLADTPELINTDPYEVSWLVRIKITDPSQLEDLMDPAAYTAYGEERG